MATWQRIAERNEEENLRLELKVSELQKIVKKKDEINVKLQIENNRKDVEIDRLKLELKQIKR